MERRQQDRLTRPGRRHSDGRPPAADNRRVLLVGSDEAWRLLNAYIFEEAGYAVYAAADEQQAIPFATRLLPDAVVARIDDEEALELIHRLADDTLTADIPVVILTASLQSESACQARANGAVTLIHQSGDVDFLIGEVDTLIEAAPRAQRTLKRRLLDLQELARYYAPDINGQASLRRLIDRLQVAVFAVDQQGRCIAASEGATLLTGYTRIQLVSTPVFQAGFIGPDLAGPRWQGFLANRHYAGTTTITTRAGQSVAVHAAAVAEIMPGVHVAAFAPI